MMRRRWGRIISISSGLGLTGVAGRAGYCSAKSGLIGLTKTAALEGARGNVTANVMFFGMVDTAGSRATVPQKHWDVIVGRNALQRAGSIQEVADVVTFYASERSAFITGTEVIIDGGQSLLVL
jgi:NAD(P)-dependent dehydrogenase (short-subunit alcohol dehydrogenase family)